MRRAAGSTRRGVPEAGQEKLKEQRGAEERTLGAGGEERRGARADECWEVEERSSSEELQLFQQHACCQTQTRVHTRTQSQTQTRVHTRARTR